MQIRNGLSVSVVCVTVCNTGNTDENRSTRNAKYECEFLGLHFLTLLSLLVVRTGALYNVFSGEYFGHMYQSIVLHDVGSIGNKVLKHFQLGNFVLSPLAPTLKHRTDFSVSLSFLETVGLF